MRVKIIRGGQLLENVVNSLNLSGFGTNRYRRALVKFCLFIFCLIVIAQISERIGILNTLNWDNYFSLSIFGPLIKSLLNKYETEKNYMSFSSNFRKYHKPSRLVLYSDQ